MIRPHIWLLAMAVAAVVVDWSLQPLLGRDTDVWWHLASGRQGLVFTDPFSHTRAGQPWHHLEWLFQALLYGVYALSGLDGVIALRSLLYLAAFGMLAAACRARGCGPWATAAAVLAAAAIATQYREMRPHVLTLAFAAAFVLVLERARRGPTRLVWLLPPLEALWFNAHGAATVGLALEVLYGGGAWLERRWGGDPPRTRWGLLLALTAAALLVNPQPLSYLWYAAIYSVLSSPFRSIISEWQAPALGDPVTWASGAFMAACLVCAALALRRRRVLDLLLVAAFVPLVASAWRHQFLFVPLLVPVLAEGLAACERRFSDLSPHLGARVVVAALLVFVTARAVADGVGRAAPPSRLVRWETLPEGACRYLIDNGIDGRLFNDINWSGYLIWRLGPRWPVFADSREDQVYDEGDLGEYLGVLRGSLDALDRRGVDIIVEHPFFFASAPLFAQALPASNKWSVGYADGTATVWLRRSRFPQAVRGPLPGSFAGDFAAGNTALAAGRLEQAVAAFRACLAAYPDFASARVALGVALAQGGHVAEAEREWRRALALNPQQPLVHGNLARAALSRGDTAAAACLLERELAISPRDEAARDALARLPAPGCRLERFRDWLLGPFERLFRN